MNEKNVKGIVKEKQISIPDETLLNYLNPHNFSDYQQSESRIFSITGCTEKNNYIK